MRILLVNNNPEGKGTFWRCFGFGKQLAKQGYEVILMCLQSSRKWQFSEKQVDGVKLILLPCLFNWGLKELPGHLYRSAYIVYYVLTRRIEVVHFFNVAFLTCGLPVFPLWLVKKSHLKHFKLIIDWDDLWGKGGLTDWKGMGKLVITTADFMETKIPLLADKVTVVSNELGKRALKAGVKPERIIRIINGSDGEAITPIGKVNARKSLGLPNDVKIVCYAAASVTMNYKFILAAFETVADLIKGVKLLVLSPLKETEKKLLLESRVGKMIEIVGFKPFSEYLTYLAAADVLLLPRSTHVLDKCEFPGRLGDFLASGRPIVINRSGDAWKIIESTHSGLVAAVDDPVDFGTKVAQILKDPHLAVRLAANGRKAALGECSWQKIVESLTEKVYAEK